jgi:hypothetical protein
VSRGQRNRSPRPYSRISRPESLQFFPSGSSVALTRLGGPRSKPTTKKKELHGLESASELYRSSDRRLSAKQLPTFADRGCHVVSVTDPYGLILGFIDKSRYFSIK